MNHYSGMEMARQVQAEYQREGGLYRRVRATKIEVPDRTTGLSGRLTFRRTAGAGASRTRREWRLSRS
jgi:hypothetical protein